MKPSGGSAQAGEVQTGAGDQYLTFMLAGEEYGIDILQVQEIRGWDGVTRIPQSPEHVLGVINLRGRVVPVVDLRRRFGLEPAQFAAGTVVAVVNVRDGGSERTVGLVLDAVSDVHTVQREHIQPPPALGDRESTAYVRGIAQVKDRMVILLDLERLVDAAEVRATIAAA